MAENYMHLIGAEGVQSAARQMQSAASDMQSAARAMDHTFEMQRRFMDDWLMRFTDVVEKMTKTTTRPRRRSRFPNTLPMKKD